MNTRVKRIFFVLIFFLVSTGIGYLLYRFFFREEPASTQTVAVDQFPGTLPNGNTATSTSVGIAPDGSGQLPSGTDIPTEPPTLPPRPPDPARTSVLVKTVTRNISSASQGGVRIYNPVDGLFYRVSPDGRLIKLSDQTFYDVQSITWGKKTDKAILTFPDESKVLYDFQAHKQYTLPSHWQDFDFSPQDDKLITKSIGINEENRFLVIANPDGTDAKPIEELGNNQDRVYPSWSPNDQIVAYAFTGDPTGYDSQSIILVGKHQENFKGLIVEGRGFLPNWSPSGNTVLYSVYSSATDYRPLLWLSGASGDNINADRRSVNLLTWADKCTWKDDFVLYCAVPTDLPEGAGLQRELASTIPDKIYKIDTRTGQTIDLGETDSHSTINQITVDANGRFLYFTDRLTGQLLKFNL